MNRAINGGFAAALVAVALPAVIAPAPVPAAARDPIMRVLIHEGPDVTLRAPAGHRLEVRDGRGRTLSWLDAHERLRLATAAGRLVSRGPAGPSSPQSELWVLSAPAAGGDRTRDAGVWLHPRRFRGAMRIVPRPGGLQVINHIRLETYLPSVVGGEMPADWPLAALQAQAVAARTYALRNRGKAGNFDLKSTVASQVYKGVESETDATREAVASTQALVLVHGGRLIDAVFHSSSGGRTANSGAVWSSQLPYLVSVPDHDSHSPVHRWRKRLDPATLRKAFSEIGGALDIRIASTSPSGRVRHAEVIGPRGRLRVSGRDLRRRLGLRSTLVTFEPVAGPGGADPSPGRLPGAQPMPRPQSAVTYRSGFQAMVASPPPAPIASAGLLAIGRGFGHGVGMSQWGAHGLALQGAAYDDILRHYYRGAEIVPHRSVGTGRLARLPAG
jgi:stage II sporulation protein D